MLRERLITAGILLPPIALILYLGGYFLVSLSIACFLIINYEFFSFTCSYSRREILRLTICSFLMPLGYCWRGWEGLALAFILAVYVALVLQVVIVEREAHEPNYSRSLPASMLGFCYTGLLGSLMIIYASKSQAHIMVTWLLALVIFSDSGAYFGGRFFGGDKLAPRISPNKTISGAISGMLCALFGSLLFSYILELPVSVSLLIPFSIVAGVLAQIGDLVQSMIKRAFGVKDVSNLLPGHGGLLDRIDAFLFALPVLFFLS
ncbi:MAG: phosphatidate cytidylyltransferase [Deltaproteobacteria bacterium]|nr:phosphatidate cytidylyltransferase [Deltaproteobacteria bacterium]